MDSQKSRRLMSVIIAVLLLVYVGYQIYKTHHTDYKTETASYFTASDSVAASGVAIKKETYVNYSGSGVVDYVLSTGDHVEKAGKIARIYSTTAQATAQRNLESTQSEVNRLKNLQAAGIAYASDIDTVTGRINDTLTDILSNTLSGDFKGASEKRENILYLINEKQMISGKVNNFNSRIETLESRSKSYQAEAGTPKKIVSSPYAGYFIKKTDGLEDAFDFSKVLSITSSQIKDLQNTACKERAGAIGKICSEYDWYFVCNVPSDKAEEFSRLMSGNVIQINFPFVSSETVPVTVAAVNKGQSDAAVVLECNYMDKSIAPIRKETAQIILKKYSGIRISKAAVHFAVLEKTYKDKNGKNQTAKKNVMGVYVLNGSNINFKQVVPEYSTDSYIICKTSPSKDELFNGSTVSLNDEVITEGTDLYDGKVIK